MKEMTLLDILNDYGNDYVTMIEAHKKICDLYAVVVPKGTYCQFYKKECMKEICSVAPNWQKCKYLK